MRTWKKIAFLCGCFVCLLLIIIVYAMTVSKSHLKSRESSSDTITVTHDHIQIREGPSTDDKIIQVADKGDKFVIRSELDNWYKISNGKMTGFIFKPILRVKQTQTREELKNKTVVIDAGHGGTDNGATGSSGIKEKDLALKTAHRLQDTLDTLGAIVVMTRDKDEYVSLEDRSDLANNVGADSFISIHYNSVPEMPEVTGISTFYFDDQNKELADALQTGIINETNARDREINFADFQVLRQNVTPAVLMELGFISNAEKEQLFLTDSYQKKLVDGIVEGLISFFTKKQDQSKSKTKTSFAG